MPTKKAQTPSDQMHQEPERELPDADDPTSPANSIWNAIEIAIRMNTHSELTRSRASDTTIGDPLLDFWLTTYPSDDVWQDFLGDLPEWQAAHLRALRAIREIWEKVRPLGESLATVTKRQQKLVEAMTEWIKEAQQHSFSERAVISNEPHAAMRDWEEVDLQESLRERDELMVKAARAGLRKHPLVADWIRHNQAWGDREGLRRLRLGLEKKVQRPFSSEEIELADRIETLRREGRSWEGVRRELIRRKWLRKNMTRQGFHKLLEKLNLRGL